MNQANPYQTPQSNISEQIDDQYDESSPFSASGRFGRVQYFLYSVGLNTLVLAVAGLLSGLLIGISQDLGLFAMTLIGLAYIAIVVLSFIFVIKRLHDLNWSGWFSLLMFLPLVNLIMGLILLFAPGTPGTNDYGYRPKPSRGGLVIVVVVFVVVMIVGILAAISIPAYQDYVERAKAAELQQN